jgi:DNA replication protein DnaC
VIIEETIDKLVRLRLPHMATALRSAIERAPGSALTVEDCVGLMVDREWTERENRRVGRRIKDAKLGMQACVEDLWSAKQNVIVIGMTGTGKSYVSAALAEAACRRGYRALRVRVPRLLDQLAIARADGSYGAALSRLAKLDVLVLDDLLIAPMKDTERRDLLEVLEDRYDQRSTVVTSQVPTKTWHEMLADPTVADAICDRLVHNAHVLSLKGPSIRKQKGLGGAAADKGPEQKR